MQLLLLTTDTAHHRWFAQQVGPWLTVVEDAPVSKDSNRDRYERELWGEPPFPRGERVENVNQATDQVGRADLTIVFGTRKLEPELIHAAKGPLLNLHGGDPERYRGLDSHLWAIYHQDRMGLVTTLHHIDERLDTGAIVLQAAIPLPPGMRLHELRAANTETCVRLTNAAVTIYADQGWLPCRPQRAEGRYYSSLPADLKPLCEQRFARIVG